LDGADEGPVARGRASWKESLLRHFPPGQFGPYLVVGVCNTVFGYSIYAGLTLLFTHHLPFPYIFASLISGFIGITFSFLTYKWFIFKTKGDYIKEWVRCVIVYSGAITMGTALLAPAVFLVRHLTPADKSAPYIAGMFLMGVNVLASFLGHKNFSFHREAT
jgi:putative flippase GtrA